MCKHTHEFLGNVNCEVGEFSGLSEEGTYLTENRSLYGCDSIVILNFFVSVESDCQSTSILEIENDVDLKLFPNPTNTLIYIEAIEINTQNLTYSIFNPNGTSVAINRTLKEEKIDLSSFIIGMYLIQFRMEDQKILNEKVVLIDKYIYVCLKKWYPFRLKTWYTFQLKFKTNRNLKNNGSEVIFRSIVVYKKYDL